VSVRVAPASPRSRTLERAATALLERALEGLDGGALEVKLPRGATRRFGAGPPVRPRGIPAVNFGPGGTRYAHAKDELVEVEALERAYLALRRVALGDLV
jgi:acetylornithine deacetylase/succinyl-diaminopimelate desuccinylase-like protein